jgi:hypothetical protein
VVPSILGQALALHGPREVLLDLLKALGERRLIDLAHDDRVAGLRRDLGDPVAHQAASEHTDLPDLRHRQPFASLSGPGG